MKASILLSIAAVIAKTSMSRSGIYAAIKDGTFPKPVMIGARRVAFIEEEVAEWIALKVAQSRS
ncbi:AlpA family transcriptional regulator [Herbaspirillum sp. SJZ099]|uniref:helix-turn-helix transcriptional regulator n=1 Tax=Herbaspirillum sp. SJZ099 TaxID=2572916 RepID=UPI0011A8A0E6|nr:AlpA family transcriptional regulator [Herbaspirillum sp. SJZ099]TWC65939.1 AlpA family transcriptional regulator [Herbaspirillum sp. SJZ099]